MKYEKHFLMSKEDAKRYAVEVVRCFDTTEGLTCEEIGDGNVNYIFRVADPETGRSLIIKQSDTVFRFSVTDTGKGIKQEDIPTTWERYYRSKETHKRPVQGTGLGLSIVKTILVKHRFVFGVDSEIGKGSTFFVDFPLVTEEEKD